MIFTEPPSLNCPPPPPPPLFSLSLSLVGLFPLVSSVYRPWLVTSIFLGLSRMAVKTGSQCRTQQISSLRRTGGGGGGGGGGTPTLRPSPNRQTDVSGVTGKSNRNDGRRRPAMCQLLSSEGEGWVERMNGGDGFASWGDDWGWGGVGGLTEIY